MCVCNCVCGHMTLGTCPSGRFTDILVSHSMLHDGKCVFISTYHRTQMCERVNVSVLSLCVWSTYREE